MKVLGLSGSPRKGGNSDVMVNFVLDGAKLAGAETKFINLNQLSIKGCQACMFCRTHEGCAIKDDMTELYNEINLADAIVIGSPVYMFQMTAQTKLFMDRLYPFLKPDYTSKVNKPTVLLFAQGNGNTEAFKPYFDHCSNAYALLGFPVKEIVVEGGSYGKGDVANREGLQLKLQTIGQTLTT